MSANTGISFSNVKVRPYINGNGVNHLASTKAVKLVIAVEFDNGGCQT